MSLSIAPKVEKKMGVFKLCSPYKGGKIWFFFFSVKVVGWGLEGVNFKGFCLVGKFRG